MTGHQDPDLTAGALARRELLRTRKLADANGYPWITKPQKR